MYLLDIIKNSYQIDQKDIHEVRYLLDKYPYFQTGYILHLIFLHDSIAESEKNKLQQKINVYITNKAYVNRVIEKYTSQKVHNPQIVNNTNTITNNNEPLFQEEKEPDLKNTKKSPDKKNTYSLKKIIEDMNDKQEKEPDTYNQIYKFKNGNKTNTKPQENKTIPSTEIPKEPPTIESDPIEQDNLIKEVLENLKKVHTSKANYINYLQTKKKEISPKITDDKKYHDEINNLLDNIKKETATETIKKINDEQEINIENIISDAQPISDKNIDTPTIKNKKQNKKQLEKEIIETFIKTNPKINVRTIFENADDTDFLKKSTTTDENIYNETIAKILLKQGKKEKCIEVYRKLIINHPYQKEYFEQKIKEIQLSNP